MADPTCGTITSTIGAPAASGTNSTAVSAPTVFNYPVQPVNDTGRQMALGAIVGGLLDALMGGDSLTEATNAEAKWKDILDNWMKVRGQSELDLVPIQRDKLPQFETDLKDELLRARALADTYIQKLPDFETRLAADGDWNKDQRDRELTLSDSTCVDDAIREVCKFVACGYTPDYNGIASRARADAEVENISAFKDACDLANRYNTRAGEYARMDIRLKTRTQFLMNTSIGREAERQFSWKTNEDMRFKHADKLEQMRIQRRKLAMDYDQRADKVWTERWAAYYKLHHEHDAAATNISEGRWSAYSESAFKSMREGGEMLAAAAQAYQFLSASIRATAKQGGGGGGIAGTLASLAAVLAIFNGSCEPYTIGTFSFNSRPKQCC